MTGVRNINSNSLHDSGARCRIHCIILFLFLAVFVLLPGCSFNNEMALRRMAQIARLGPGDTIKVNEVNQPGQLGTVTGMFSRPPELTERTQQVLRRYNLAERYGSDPDEVIHWMKNICSQSPDMSEVNALAEISLVQADWSRRRGEPTRATQLYATAVVHAYQFLFDPSLNLQRNAYDPQFRAICDVYNSALEGLIRDIVDSAGLDSESIYTIGSGDLAIELKTEVQGRWRNQAFEKFELTNSYEMEGIDNLYHTYGLGVPLIAVHQQDVEHRPAEKYYPPSLPLPMTAFLEVDESTAGPEQEGAPVRAVLKLFDPLETTSVVTGGRTIPLESDISTPLAYSVNDPMLNTSVVATASMINPQIVDDMYGLYMFEPFDPNKIPVVMVHGLWSSPVTWLEMFNDLRANRDLHNNYQFWFYAYPTGQPFWITARQMREELAGLKRELDPENTSRSLDQMVLVGHSMGGLVSRLQTISSKDEFWKIVSDHPFESLTGDAAALQALEETFFFDPNPSVKRVVMIASPSRGSPLANSASKWLSHNIFTLPEIVSTDFKKIARENSDLLRDPRMLTVTTSIDSLAPDSPFFDVMLESAEDSDIPVHSIYGVVPASGILANRKSEGDGVVSTDSAKADKAVSRIEVAEEHSKLHQHPRSVLEVRRILLEHLVSVQRMSDPRLPVIPTGANLEFGDEAGSVKHAFR